MRLGLPHLTTSAPESPVIVCHCAVVSDRDVHTAVAQGARTVGAVCRSTGAAQDCGSCIFTVKALVCQHQAQDRELLEVDGAAS
nr:(2Fe-2S)-binding protein [Nocardioides gansuensis]